MFDEFWLTHTHWIPLSSLYVGCDFLSPDMLSTLPPSAYPKFVVMSPTSPITAKNMGANEALGACTYDVYPEGRDGVGQILTKGREVSWIWY